MKNNLHNFIIFVLTYVLSLIVNIFLGINNIAFGDITKYCIIFCVLESLTMFVFNLYIKIVLFLLNIYISKCLTILLIIISSKSKIDYKFIFSISLKQYFFLGSISFLLSLIAFIVMIVRKKLRTK